MRGADPITLDHALVYPDSVVETEMRDGTAVRVRSIPASEFYRVEQWESGVARSAGAVALVAAGSVWLVYALMVGWMASET
ncbi:MAG TPA: hypothetical protein VFH27_05385 [Longimicrobiaceae bacterium]|nr:hypothetical protein [Longimicrobiaceae bacterium]